MLRIQWRPALRGHGQTSLTATPRPAPLLFSPPFPSLFLPSPSRLYRRGNQYLPRAHRRADGPAPAASACSPCCPHTWKPGHLAMRLPGRWAAGAGAWWEKGKAVGRPGWGSHRPDGAVHHSHSAGPGAPVQSWAWTVRAGSPQPGRPGRGCRRV